MKDFLIENWFLLVILVVWDLIWKMVAMYRAAQDDSKLWYVILAFLNTIGILPIIYLTKIHKAEKKA